MTYHLVTAAPVWHGKEAKRPPRGGAGRALPALCAGLGYCEVLRIQPHEKQGEAHT